MGVARVTKLSDGTDGVPLLDGAVPDQELLQQVVTYYAARLKESPKALQYLQDRKLNHHELLDTFKLGYADRSLGLRLPAKQWKAGREIRSRLIQVGVYRGTGREHFNGSIVIPIFDAQGSVVEVYGRKVTPNLRPGTPLHLYVAGASRHLEPSRAPRQPDPRHH